MSLKVLLFLIFRMGDSESYINAYRKVSVVLKGVWIRWMVSLRRDRRDELGKFLKKCFELSQSKMVSRTKKDNIYLKTDKSVIVQPFLGQWWASYSLSPVLFCPPFSSALVSFAQDTFLEGEHKPPRIFFLYIFVWPFKALVFYYTTIVWKWNVLSQDLPFHNLLTCSFLQLSFFLHIIELFFILC